MRETTTVSQAKTVIDDSNRDLIIVGGGIGGAAVAMRAAQYGLKATWFLGDKATAKRSRSQWVRNIDNMIGLHDSIVRRKIVKELKGAEWAEARERVEGGHSHIGTRDIVDDVRDRLERDYSEWIDQRFEVVGQAGRVEQSGPASGGFVARFGSDQAEQVRASHMVLSTGVMDRQPFIAKQKNGEVLDEPKWIYPFANRESVLYCIRCEGHLTRGAEAAVIGHGPAAAQLAMMLFERYGSTSFVLTNGEEPQWSEDDQFLLSNYGIEVIRERIVDVGGSKGELNSLVLEGGREVAVRFALVSLGLFKVYNELAQQLGAELMNLKQPLEERHVRIDRNGETSVPNFFCVGDLAAREDERVMKQVYTAQEYAVRAVDTIDRRVRNARRRAILSQR